MVKQMQKDGLSEDNARDTEVIIQDLTDTYSRNIDSHVSDKEKEIMTI